jgi:hypothetical protein
MLAGFRTNLTCSNSKDTGMNSSIGSKPARPRRRLFKNLAFHVIGLMSLLGIAAPAMAQAQSASAAGQMSSVQNAVPLPQSAEYTSWQAAIAASHPAGNGCVEADYPSTNWKVVSCGKQIAAQVAVRQKFRVLPFDENTSGDYTLTAAHPIDFVYGSLPYVENVTSVYGFGQGNGTPVPNEYNLQINTQSNLPANGPGQLCSNAPWGPNGAPPNRNRCTGWMQFVLDSGGSINIQYWAINYGPSCPGNLELSGPQNSCGTRAGSSFSIPIPANFEALAGATISGYVYKDNAGNIVDRAGIAYGGKAYESNATPDIAGAYGNWFSVQFNVYGNSAGDESIFNSGSLIAVGLHLITDPGNTVSCSGPGGTTTGESTNLTETPCVTTNTPAPSNIHGITFNEGVAPVISGISPNAGPAAGGTSVTITALSTSPNNTPVINGFAPSAVIMFGSVAAARNCAAASCVAVSPPGTGNVLITAANMFQNGMAGPSSALSTIPSTNNLFSYISSGGGGGGGVVNCKICIENGGRCVKVGARWSCQDLQ